MEKSNTKKENERPKSRMERDLMKEEENSDRYCLSRSQSPPTSRHLETADLPPVRRSPKEALSMDQVIELGRHERLDEGNYEDYDLAGPLLKPIDLEFEWWYRKTLKRTGWLWTFPNYGYFMSLHHWERHWTENYKGKAEDNHKNGMDLWNFKEEQKNRQDSTMPIFYSSGNLDQDRPLSPSMPFLLEALINGNLGEDENDEEEIRILEEQKQPKGKENGKDGGSGEESS